MMKAAEQDYGYAQFKMGDYYFFGCGPCLEDNKKAMEWYEKAVANEIPMAMLRMGEYYLYDYDSLNESEKAFAYFKKAAEYEWYSEGLGICYEMGIGVEDNETEAFKYYTLAADNGNTTYRPLLLQRSRRETELCRSLPLVYGCGREWKYCCDLLSW